MSDLRQADAEVALPQPIDDDAGRERVVARRRATGPGRAGWRGGRRRRAAAGSAASCGCDDFAGRDPSSCRAAGCASRAARSASVTIVGTNWPSSSTRCCLAARISSFAALLPFALDACRRADFSSSAIFASSFLHLARRRAASRPASPAGASVGDVVLPTGSNEP